VYWLVGQSLMSANLLEYEVSLRQRVCCRLVFFRCDVASIVPRQFHFALAFLA
jgi:hypothetical protein